RHFAARETPLTLRSKRQDPQPRHRQLAFVAIRRDTNLDLFLRNIDLQRPMKAIPPRKDGAPIRISFAPDDRVMNAVHAGSHDHAVERTLETEGQTPVRMMKKRRAFKENLEHQK